MNANVTNIRNAPSLRAVRSKCATCGLPEWHANHSPRHPANRDNEDAHTFVVSARRDPLHDPSLPQIPTMRTTWRDMLTVGLFFTVLFIVINLIDGIVH